MPRPPLCRPPPVVPRRFQPFRTLMWRLRPLLPVRRCPLPPMRRRCSLLKWHSLLPALLPPVLPLWPLMTLPRRPLVAMCRCPSTLLLIIRPLAVVRRRPVLVELARPRLLPRPKAVEVARMTLSTSRLSTLLRTLPLSTMPSLPVLLP